MPRYASRHVTSRHTPPRYLGPHDFIGAPQSTMLLTKVHPVTRHGAILQQMVMGLRQ
jgi:hypothetical protein